MGGIIDAIKSFAEKLWDAVSGILEGVWDSIMFPILEEVFGWFGIEAEDVVSAQRVSTKLFETATSDMYQEAIIRTVLAMPKNNAGFFRNYMQQVYGIKGQMVGLYRFCELDRYQTPLGGGLPEMDILAGQQDLNATLLALRDWSGDNSASLLNVDSQVINYDPTWFGWYMQENGTYDYQLYDHTITYPDQNNDLRPGWAIDDIIYNDLLDNYDIQISRIFEETKFWIEGPHMIREGDTGNFSVSCNRTVTGSTGIVVNLVYSGTAVDGTNYNAVASVTIDPGTSTKAFTIDTLESGDGTVDMTVTIDSLVDAEHVFEYRSLAFPDVTTLIKDDDGIILTIDDIHVAESIGLATVGVKLEGATAGSFTVTATTTNGTAVSPVDYTYTQQSLFFTGTAGEIVTFQVPIANDAEADDGEYLEIVLSNCSDPAVDITQTGRIWIDDGTGQDPAQTNATVNEVFQLPNYIREPYLVVKWRTSSDPYPYVNQRLWLYRIADGTYPDIEPYSRSLTVTDMMPIIALRQNKIDLVDYKTFGEGNVNYEWWKSTRLALQNLGLDMDVITDSYKENPSINDIDDVYINFGAAPTDTHPAVSEILYRSFRIIAIDYGVTSNKNSYQASYEEGDIKCTMIWWHHEFTLNNAGTVTTVGKYTHHIEDAVDAQGATKRLVLRHQHSAGLYDEIRVDRLSNANLVSYGGYHTMTVTACNETDTNFTFPVAYGVLKEMQIKDLVQAYPYILRMDLHAIVVTHLEFYETEAFWDLFSFVAIVITIVTAGFAGGFLAVLQQLAINYLIIELVIWVAEETGNEFLAAVVGIVATIALGNTGALQAVDFTSAADLVDLSTKFADNLTAAYAVELQDIGQSLQELNAEAENRLEEIQDVMDAAKSPLSTEWLVALQSQTSQQYLALSAQYDFDQLYSYDRLISDYHTNKLRTGVI